MQIRKWRKQHKILGLCCVFFLVLCSLSGIILNHRETVSEIEISRKWLPEAYHFQRWNNGLMRGSLPFSQTGDEHVLVYGTGGIWLLNKDGSFCRDFNEGLPHQADKRNIRSTVKMPDNMLFAASTDTLFRYNHIRHRWESCKNLALQDGEKISDLTSWNDSLIITGRSYLYISRPPYITYDREELPPPPAYKPEVSLFRIVWQLHSGEIFGNIGRMFADAIAIIFILLCLTGFCYWITVRIIRRKKQSGLDIQNASRHMRRFLKWHDRPGRYAFFLLMFSACTGWCLRPPVLIALANIKSAPLPGTELDNPNPWHDRLRMLRYDTLHKEWLISTSEGFYSMKKLGDSPCPTSTQPPVSVMGINVWQTDKNHNWLIGSFSGMYRWDYAQGIITDYFSGERVASGQSGPPFGKQAIAGYSDDFNTGTCIVDYTNGTTRLAMPDTLRHLPMSLWNIALEVHTGRIFTFLGKGTLVYITFAGLAFIWCIYSGYAVRIRKNKHRHNRKQQ